MSNATLIRSLILGAAAFALSGCYEYEAPPPAPAYGYSQPDYGGYYYGPAGSFGFYGDVHHHDEDWYHGDDD